MLQIKNLYLKYGDRILLDEINTTISDGEKVAIVGRNGAGKSTLLKIIAKLQGADHGEIDMPKETKVAYLRQEIDFDRLNISGFSTCILGQLSNSSLSEMNVDRWYGVAETLLGSQPGGADR